jgi:hypothetical protein
MTNAFANVVDVAGLLPAPISVHGIHDPQNWGAEYFSSTPASAAPPPARAATIASPRLHGDIRWAKHRPRSRRFRYDRAGIEINANAGSFVFTGGTR